MNDVTAKVAQDYGDFADLFGNDLGKKVLDRLTGEYDTASDWSGDPILTAKLVGAANLLREIKGKIRTAEQLKTGQFVALQDATGQIRIVKKTEVSDADREPVASTRPELAF